MADRSAAVLTEMVLCDDPAEAVDVLATQMAMDPPLALWAVCRARGKLNEPRGIRDIAAWLQSQTLDVLQWETEAAAAGVLAVAKQEAYADQVSRRGGGLASLLALPEGRQAADRAGLLEYCTTRAMVGPIGDRRIGLGCRGVARLADRLGATTGRVLGRGSPGDPDRQSAGPSLDSAPAACRQRADTGACGGWRRSPGQATGCRRSYPRNVWHRWKIGFKRPRSGKAGGDGGLPRAGRSTTRWPSSGPGSCFCEETDPERRRERR